MNRSGVLLLAGLMLAGADAASAESPLNAKGSMHDNLTALLGAKTQVTVVLKNGTNYRATIAAVGDQNVLLSGPTQKEFFDVLIPIDDISALEVKARDK